MTKNFFIIAQNQDYYHGGIQRFLKVLKVVYFFCNVFMVRPKFHADVSSLYFPGKNCNKKTSSGVTHMVAGFNRNP